ncbi:hypothetical protein [uncultured Mediterranean phage uvMED]|nr:hypothetical protein [uncultured Mediterranean phage uvMED]
MCISIPNPFRRKKRSTPAPPPPPVDGTVRAQREMARRKELAEREKMKEEQYQDTLSTLTGRRGRRSLLSGRRGGRGFQVAAGTTTRETLGV